MSYEEIAQLKKFETVFQYIYNSKKFIQSIKYLETKFDNSYEMYEHITAHFIENNMIDIKQSYDSIYLALLKLFSNDEILVQTLTYDYVGSLKSVRDWMYSKYDLKEEVSNYIKENKEFEGMTVSEMNKKYKFIVLDYDVHNNKKEKTIYKFDRWGSKEPIS